MAEAVPEIHTRSLLSPVDGGAHDGLGDGAPWTISSSGMGYGAPPCAAAANASSDARVTSSVRGFPHLRRALGRLKLARAEQLGAPLLR